MNRFSKPQQSEFMNTYVAPPLEMMQKALESKQQQYNDVKLASAQYNDQLTGLEVTGPYATQYLAGVQQKFGSVLEDLKGKDLLDPNNQKKLESVITEIDKDQELKQHLTANKYIKEWKDNYSKLQAENGINQANTWKYEMALNQYAQTGKMSGILQDTSINKAVDRYAELSKFYKDIKASGSNALAFLSSPNGKIAYETSQDGVDHKRIVDQTNRILDVAASSAVGQELLREYEMLSFTSKQPVSEAGYREYLKGNLLSVGEGFEYSKTGTSGLASAYNKKRDESNLQLNALSVTQGPLVNNKTTAYAEYDEKGNLVPKQYGLSDKLYNSFDTIRKNFNNPAMMGAAMGAIWGAEGVTKDDKQFVTNTWGHKLAAKANGMSDKELEDTYHKQNVNFKLDVLSSKKATEYDKVMFGSGLKNALNFGFLEEGTGNPVDAKTAIMGALKEQGVEVNDSNFMEVLEDYKPQVSAIFQPNEVSPLSAQVTIGNVTRTVDLSYGGTLNVDKDKIKAHRDAKLHHYKYLAEPIKTKDGKDALKGWYIDKDGNTNYEILEIEQ